MYTYLYIYIYTYIYINLYAYIYIYIYKRYVYTYIFRYIYTGPRFSGAERFITIASRNGGLAVEPCARVLLAKHRPTVLSSLTPAVGGTTSGSQLLWGRFRAKRERLNVFNLTDFKNLT